ncbi:MAG TPA: pyridoxamine 5'-phosphate oxidase family protein, partial [Synergistales bacterium]|nr:pyridoxamine 5'-phosphate oxidase family protein [Synergistales bacterium]
GDSVTLLGNVAVLTDEQTRKELWQEWFIKHFPKGPDDPDYCVLKFDTVEATVYINEVFETHRV